MHLTWGKCSAQIKRVHKAFELFFLLPQVMLVHGGWGGGGEVSMHKTFYKLSLARERANYVVLGDT